MGTLQIPCSVKVFGIVVVAAAVAVAGAVAAMVEAEGGAVVVDMVC